MRKVPVAALLVSLAACGGETTVADTPPEQSSAPPEPTVTTTAGNEHVDTEIEQPPPFRVRFDDQELALHPHTYCYENVCVDGVVTDPPSVGSPAELWVYVPVKRFDLSVHVRELTRAPEPGSLDDDTCGGRSFEVPVDDLGDGWYAVPAYGPAGVYQVELFASGDGDMIASLHWRTPADGEMPTPSARLALIAENDGEPDSYGLELGVDNLRRTPDRASAGIEVTAGNGRSMTLEAQQSRDRCRGEGSLYFDRPDAPAKAAARLGPFPFTTKVTLTLDGKEHTATAVYPDDEIKGNEPSVSLEFDPPLPGL